MIYAILKHRSFVMLNFILSKVALLCLQETVWRRAPFCFENRGPYTKADVEENCFVVGYRRNMLQKGTFCIYGVQSITRRRLDYGNF